MLNRRNPYSDGMLHDRTCFNRLFQLVLLQIFITFLFNLEKSKNNLRGVYKHEMTFVLSVGQVACAPFQTNIPLLRWCMTAGRNIFLLYKSYKYMNKHLSPKQKVFSLVFSLTLPHLLAGGIEPEGILRTLVTAGLMIGLWYGLEHLAHKAVMRSGK